MRYGRLIDNDGACLRDPLFGTPIGVSSGSTAFMNQMADDLDDAIADVADGYQYQTDRYVAFLDPREEFAGKGVCSDSPAVNGIRSTLRASESGSILDPVKASAESFHPNKKGTDIYAQLLSDWLDLVIK